MPNIFSYTSSQFKSCTMQRKVTRWTAANSVQAAKFVEKLYTR